MTTTKPRRAGRLARLGITTTLMLSALVPACLDRPIETLEPPITFSFTEVLPQQKVDKIDILLTIDDSRSMGDKQQILADAVPDLVNELVNPNCVGDGPPVKVSGPLAECPEGMRRDFTPVLDIHIGVISTSLGGRGSNACTGKKGEKNDKNAQLLSQQQGGDPDMPTYVPTFEDKGFLAWDPLAAAVPGSHQDADALSDDLTKIVLGVGQDGCGYEAQLESWYRFLVDPSPYESVELTGNKAALVGVDQNILQQRADFLRPDSLVAIVMLTDENDCSFKPNTYGYFTGNEVGGNDITKLKARAVCDTNPNDPCCAPCSAGGLPETCPDDPTCSAPQPQDRRQRNLRCFEQKRRHGIDFLHKTKRYIDGLTAQRINDRDGNEVDNPLLVAADGELRGLDRVFLAGIVGVPWQLIARNPANLKDGFQNAQELSANGTWDKILGNPAEHVPPSDAHMVESIYARDGLAPMGSSPDADPINGHEFEVNLYVNGPTAVGQGDLQYACTFELPTPIDCSSGGDGNCDCAPVSDPGKIQRYNDPLCQAPDGSYGTTQYRAKAFPGLRQLEVLKGIEDSGIVGSICPGQITDPDNTAVPYGYRPAIEALIERLKKELTPPCLARPLTPDPESKQVTCLVLEGQKLQAGEGCDCQHAAARRLPLPVHKGAVNDAMERPAAIDQGIDCLCEILQTSGDDLNACQNDVAPNPEVDGEEVDGWCYIDETVGEDELVAHCKSDPQTIRFVGEGQPVNDTLIFMTCQSSN